MRHKAPWPPQRPAGRASKSRRAPFAPLRFFSRSENMRTLPTSPRRGKTGAMGPGREMVKKLHFRALLRFRGPGDRLTADLAAWLPRWPCGLHSAAGPLPRARRGGLAGNPAPYAYTRYVIASKRSAARLYITTCRRNGAPRVYPRRRIHGASVSAILAAAPRRSGPGAARTPARPAWGGATFPPQPRRPTHTADKAVKSGDGARGSGLRRYRRCLRPHGGDLVAMGLSARAGAPCFGAVARSRQPSSATAPRASAPARDSSHHAFLNTCSIFEWCYSFV